VEAVTLERLREAELVTEARVRAGLSPPIDKNRAVLQRLQQTATVADLDGLLRQSTAQLGVALGITDELDLVDMPALPGAPPPPVQVLLDDARQGRPEVAVARLRADAQRFAVRMAKSGYYPQLNAFMLFQFGNNPLIVGAGARATSDAVNPFANLAGDLTIGAQLSMNFFDTLNTWTSVRDAGYEEARLQEDRRRVERIIDTDVRVQHANVLRLFAMYEPTQQAREVARQNLSILQTRYQNGDALFIEFLQGQIDLARAERQLVDATAQLHLAWLELEAALGKVVGVSR
jgi:outer membrane protein TolC